MGEQPGDRGAVGSRFPFFGLEKALARAKELYAAAGEHEMTLSDAFEVWGYSLKSSGGHQTVAALKMYQIIQVSKDGHERKLAFTPDALRYFRDERGEVIASLKRNFAVAPGLNRMLYTKWGPSPPADNIARSYLKIERGLSDQAARSLLGIYKENLSFANLNNSDSLGGEDGDGEEGDSTPTPPSMRKGTQVMENERVLADGLLSRNTTFRVIVTGVVGPKEIDRLIKKLEIDKEILSEPNHTDDDPLGDC